MAKWSKHFRNLTPLQKQILRKLWGTIQECEGVKMPEKYWCDSCKMKWRNFHKLFVKFTAMNANSIQPHYYTQFQHPGFSDPDITDQW